ncbi:LuxS/MPP-like metallohydrolase [Coemansia reversa NRRL 1564]|uniref:LuxS/MPP-like metallohydrolase n=1 Tax=Coemansia reversa (strain ATCC 12441 / NRRL 1564) TaxID=763665 RepID=A0A2G5BAB0_COERN|nr:LuxS/MPP-like metallohydrolase [Coemansia reversa NRRL 1564]|eukprot:PIA15951.1 LuxS/MPP-like metallohydrolase [Coemansia reversa NRRL 1564]
MRQHLLFDALLVIVFFWLSSWYSTKGPQENKEQHPNFVLRKTTELNLPYYEYGGTLEQSPNDLREYKLIRLPNNLVAVCVHDSNITNAAASLSVNVGSFADPPELLGLAHFVEHMLFKGSEKYPLEPEYMSYILNNSGSCNAFTSQTWTTYLFEVTNTALEGGLDRISRFFIDPLFPPDAIDKELNSMESEFKKNLQSDIWRLQNIHAVLSNANHPYSRFTTGNLMTLRDTSQALNYSLHDQVVDFHKKFYSADVMKLAIVGNYTTDQLVEWAVAKFSDIKSKGDTKPQYSGHPLNSNALGKVIYFETIGKYYILNMEFALPEIKSLYATSPDYYISILLANKGPGSLYFYLKEREWASSVGGYISNPDYDGFNIFTITVIMTPEGYENHKNIVRAVFAYLQMLTDNGPQQWIHEELRTISDLDFKYLEKPSSIATVQDLSINTHNKYVAPEHYLTAYTLVRDYDAKGISNMLKYLNPQNYRISIGAQSHSIVNCTEREKYYNVSYHLDTLPPSLSSEMALNWKKLYDFHLPTRNKFLPENTDVITKESPREKVQLAPTLLRLTNNTELWFKQDDQFLTPHGHICLSIRLPNTITSPLDRVLAQLVDKCISKVFSSEFHAAVIAGITYSVTYSGTRVEIKLAGFSDKLPLVLESILAKLASFKIEKHIFSMSMSVLKQHYQNERHVTPYLQLMHTRDRKLHIVPFWPAQALESVMDNAKIEKAQALIDSMLDQSFSKLLVVGNFNESDALNMIHMTEKVIKPKTMPSYLYSPTRVVDIKPGHYIYRDQLQDKNEPNNAALVTIYCGPANSMKERLVINMLKRILYEPFFDQLRTREQLGYIVSSQSKNYASGKEMLMFLVQSESNPVYLTQRIDRFIRNFRKYILGYSTEDFDALVDTVISAKDERPRAIDKEAELFWNSIYSSNYDFDYIREEITCLQQLNKEDILEAWDNYVNPETATQYTRVDSHLWSAKLSYPTDKELSVYSEGVVSLHRCLESEGFAGINISGLDRFVQGASLESGIEPLLKSLEGLYISKTKPTLNFENVSDMRNTTQNIEKLNANGSKIKTALEMALKADSRLFTRSASKEGTDFARIGMRQTPESKWIIRNIDLFKAALPLHGVSLSVAKPAPKHTD